MPDEGGSCKGVLVHAAASIRLVSSGLSRRKRDLAVVIGSQPHALEALNRRRPLTLPMIRALSAEWKLPADVLVREYDLVLAR